MVRLFRIGRGAGLRTCFGCRVRRGGRFIVPVAVLWGPDLSRRYGTERLERGIEGWSIVPMAVLLGPDLSRGWRASRPGSLGVPVAVLLRPDSLRRRNLLSFREVMKCAGHPDYDETEEKDPGDQPFPFGSLPGLPTTVLALPAAPTGTRVIPADLHRPSP